MESKTLNRKCMVGYLQMHLDVVAAEASLIQDLGMQYPFFNDLVSQLLEIRKKQTPIDSPFWTTYTPKKYRIAFFFRYPQHLIGDGRTMFVDTATASNLVIILEPDPAL